LATYLLTDSPLSVGKMLKETNMKFSFLCGYFYSQHMKQMAKTTVP